MKKMLYVILFVFVLTACEAHPTKIVHDVKYVEKIKTSRGELLSFEDKEGYRVNYFVDPSDSFNLVRGNNYRIKVTINNILQYGDFIKEATNH
jgi:uncharacterized protein YcfL